MRFKLLNLFSLFHFGLLFVFLVVFLSLQYNLQKEFQDHTLKSFFDQSHSALQAILARENEELKDVVNSLKSHDTLPDNDDIHIDFLFISKNDAIIDIQGFNISVDIHKIAKKLITSPMENSVIKTIVIDSVPYYMLVHNEPLVDQKLGKVLGRIWGVKLLNNNQFFINTLKKDLNIQGILFLDKNNTIVNSTIPQDQLKSFNIFVKENDITISIDKKYIFVKKDLTSNFQILYILHNNKHAYILDYFASISKISIVLFFLISLISFYLIKNKFIAKLLEIREFIKNKLANKQSNYQNSNIIELDTIVHDFNILFKEHEVEKTKFKQLLDYSSDAIFILDTEGKLQEYSKETQRLLGYSDSEMKQLCIDDWDKNFSKQELLEMLQTQPFDQIRKFETIHTRKDGSYYNTAITAIKIHFEDKDIIYASARDITQAKLQERVLKEHVSLIDQYILTSSTDLHGIITEASSAFSRLSGYSKEELIGSNHNIIRHPDTPDFIFKDLWDTLHKDAIWKGEIKNRKKCGGYYWIDTTIMPIFDENKKKIGYTSVRHNITDKKHIEKISKTDPLTGLFNRRYFDELFLKILNSAKRDSKIFSFVILDIDHFKQYNDTYGHQKGDEVLKQVSKTIQSSLNRVDDYCFRLGGEEFGVIFKSDSIEYCKSFADSIRINIENLQIEHQKNSASSFVTSSLGLISIQPTKTSNIDEVYKLADQLLYKAKENGRNQVMSNH